MQTITRATKSGTTKLVRIPTPMLLRSNKLLAARPPPMTEGSRGDQNAATQGILSSIGDALAVRRAAGRPCPATLAHRITRSFLTSLDEQPQTPESASPEK